LESPGRSNILISQRRRRFFLFFCAAFRRDLIRATGLLDEVFNPGYGEDIDFCRKVGELGYKVVQVPDNEDLSNHQFPLWHQESKTVHEVPGWEDIVQRNEGILAARYNRQTNLTKYSIIIPTYNHLDDYLKPCLESIRQNTDLSFAEVIVVANGCTDGTGDYVRSLGPKFKLIEHTEPLGYTKATNIGMAAAKGDYVVLLGNDCTLQGNNWLQILEQPFIDRNVGMTGPLIQTHPETHIDFLVFFCVMLRREVIQRCGLLDEIYSPGYGEDIDYCKKVTDAGYKLVQVPTTGTVQLFPIYHKAGGTVRYLPGWDEIVQRNTDLLVSRFGKKFKVYDCFMYFNEPDMLELRLNVLNDVVDVFVITESTNTFSGQSKSLFLEDTLKEERFLKFAPKIVHLIAGGEPFSVIEQTDNRNEAHQRNYTYRALHHCNDDDIIILSDVDEIPNPEVIRSYNATMGISSLKQKLYYYNMNCLSNQVWLDPKIGPWRDVREVPPQDLRHVTVGWRGMKIIENGGWHFSHFGNVAALSKKIAASRHVELNTESINNPANIADAVQKGRDVYGRDFMHFKFTLSVDETYPKYVLDRHRPLQAKIGFIRSDSETATVKHSIVSSRLTTT
jgi:beta-1,4-mannosyl-glycoprotein beta-1,4-N-acetylglucosaminyltransferase